MLRPAWAVGLVPFLFHAGLALATQIPEDVSVSPGPNVEATLDASAGPIAVHHTIDLNASNATNLTPPLASPNSGPESGEPPQSEPDSTDQSSWGPPPTDSGGDSSTMNDGAGGEAGEMRNPVVDGPGSSPDRQTREESQGWSELGDAPPASGQGGASAVRRDRSNDWIPFVAGGALGLAYLLYAFRVLPRLRVLLARTAIALWAIRQRHATHGQVVRPSSHRPH